MEYFCHSSLNKVSNFFVRCYFGVDFNNVNKAINSDDVYKKKRNCEQQQWMFFCSL